MQLQSLQSFWTHYHGIISFPPKHVLTLLDTDTLLASGRFLLCKVSRPNNFYESIFILNLYAPDNPNTDRRLHATDTISLHRLIISGDFSYDFGSDILRNSCSFKTSTDWVTFLLDYFYNCMTFNNFDTVQTFQRNASIHSIIYYVYAGNDIQNIITETCIVHIQPQWYDRAILSVQFSLGESQLGPRLWRGNPVYATNKSFQKLLEQKIGDHGC
ncbi:hypothetical protein BDF21DRAFT_399369 [Thamnidium elegans]|nr:hypothetical protein BDF21DRAFT_399369 [Thamnidium elegans]